MFIKTHHSFPHIHHIQDPIIPFEQRPPNYYLRIPNILSKTDYQCPPISRRPQISILQAFHSLDGLFQDTFHKLKGSTPVSPVVGYSVNSSAARLSQAVCSSMEQVMNRQPNPNAGIWYPREFQELCAKNGRVMPTEYQTGHIDEEFFEKSAADGEISFSLRPGKNPSEGLLRFFNGPTISVCGMTAIACAYKALLDVYGAERFDHMFTNDFPFVIEDAISEELFEETDTNKHSILGTYGNRVLQVGDLCRFENTSLYRQKHPCGAEEGLNCVYMGRNAHFQQVFGGLGLESPLTEGEIYKWLIMYYNQPRTEADIKFLKAMDPKFDDSDTKKDFPRISTRSPYILEKQAIVSFHAQSTFRLRIPTP